MNNRSIIQAPGPEGRGTWIDSYMPDGQMSPFQPQPQLINFQTVRGILFRQRWLILGVVAAAVLVGLILTLLSTPMYQAQAKVIVEPYGSYILEGQDINQGVASNQTYDYLGTQIEVIKSRSLAEVVVADLNLAERNDLLGDDIEERRSPGMSDEKWMEAKRKMAASMLVGSVVAEFPEDKWVIPIGFRSQDPALAAELANAYADAFVASGTRSSVENNEYAVNYLRDQIQQVREQLADSERVANTYARNSGIIVQPMAGSDESGGTIATLRSSNLASINQRVADARAARIVAEQRWRSIQNLPAAQLPEVQNSAVLQGLISDRTEKSAQLADLRQRYNDDFPQIRNLQAQLAVLDTQIDKSSAEIKAAVRNEYTVALNQQNALEAELGAVKGETLAEQDQNVELSVMEREAQALRDQLKALLDRYNQLSSAAQVNSGAIRKLDAATVPSVPYAPNMMQNMVIALVFGIALAGGLAVLRETLDDRIRSLEDVEERIGLPLLGHTPFVEESDIEAAGTNRFSALIEAYSSIRAAVDFTLPRNRNVLQLTSSHASEGKSTTSVILAELFASLGRKTLLVDADLRRPSVASLLDIEKPKVGFVEVLLGHVELSAAIVKGVHENLEILPVGDIPPNPAEILASVHMKEFIEKYRDEYSVIIFDSCPVMGLADAPLLGGLVDGTIFVLEANKVPFGQARTALRRLRLSGSNVLGVVLTKYRALTAGQSQSYQYGYYQYGEKK